MSTDNPNAFHDFNWLKKILEIEQKEKVQASDRKLRHKYTGTRKGFKRMKKARGGYEEDK